MNRDTVSSDDAKANHDKALRSVRVLDEACIRAGREMEEVAHRVAPTAITAGSQAVEQQRQRCLELLAELREALSTFADLRQAQAWMEAVRDGILIPKAANFSVVVDNLTRETQQMLDAGQARPAG